MQDQSILLRLPLVLKASLKEAKRHARDKEAAMLFASSLTVDYKVINPIQIPGAAA